MDFKPDLSEPEREQFAGILREMASEANAAAENLLAEADDEFLTSFFHLTLQIRRGEEIIKFLQTEVEKI